MSSLLRRLTVPSGSVQPNAAVSVKFAQQYDTLVAFRDAEMSLRRQQCRRALSGNDVVTQWMWAVGHASRVDVAAAGDAVPRLDIPQNRGGMHYEE